MGDPRMESPARSSWLRLLPCCWREGSIPTRILGQALIFTAARPIDLSEVGPRKRKGPRSSGTPRVVLGKSGGRELSGFGLNRSDEGNLFSFFKKFWKNSQNCIAENESFVSLYMRENSTGAKCVLSPSKHPVLADLLVPFVSNRPLVATAGWVTS